MKGSWKTSLAGVVGGCAVAVSGIIQANAVNGHVNWSSISTGIVIAIIGVLSKDFDTTGGSRPSA
jgi:hypothetical protein